MKLKGPPAQYIPSREELAEFDKLEDDDTEDVQESADVATPKYAVGESREDILDGKLIEWDGGVEIILAALEAIEPGWRWSEERIVGYCDEKGRDPHYDWEMPPLPEPPKLTPEERAARDRATEEELLAFQRQMDGPFHYVERNRDPSKPSVGSQWLSPNGRAEAKRPKPKGGRKSRKKPVFYTPKQVD